MPYYIKKKPKLDENGNIIYSSLKRKTPLKPISDKKKEEIGKDKGRSLKTSQKGAKPTKKRTKSKATLMRELDAVFSKFIRLRDSKPFGFKYCKCISCGQVKPFEQIDAGHYYSRRLMNVRFDEDNVNAECRACNRFDSSHLIGYRDHLIDKIGDGRYQLLRVRANMSKKWEIWELEQLIKFYKARIEELTAPQSRLGRKGFQD